MSLPPPTAASRTAASRTAGTAGLAILVAVLYGGHLGDGYLADDFVYLGWLDEGWDELLRRVTADSDPRMIRPLPALAWGLSIFPGGAAWQHGLSLLAHLICGLLVVRLAERTSGSRRLGLLLGALFLSFPLFTEPVIWLSAAPDLWAAACALGALDLGLRKNPTRSSDAGAALLFLLSLLSKESTVLLPLVALCLGPWRRTRRLAAVLAAVAAVYLAGRMALFHGPGGYLDPQGQARALDVDPLRFLRNVFLQLPYRLLVPVKRAGNLALLLAATTAGLALAVAAGARSWRRSGRTETTFGRRGGASPTVHMSPQAGVFRALGALLVALLPVAAFFSIDPDHESSRLLYFPVAVLAAALGGAIGRPKAPLRWALVGLLIFWGLATLANGRSWSEGAREVRQTLAALRAVEETFPAGATVLVAGHDTWHGAYVWRNGLAFAARREGLRDDLHWRLGTAALVPGSDLGRTVFEIEVGEDGRPRDWTPCQRALHRETVRALAEGDLTRVAGPAVRLETGPLSLSPPAPAVAVEILLAERRGREAVEGRLYWRRPDGVRFNVTESRRFRIFPLGGPRGDATVPGAARSIVRLPASRRPLDVLELRLELAGSSPELRAALRVVALPAICPANDRAGGQLREPGGRDG